MLVELPSLWIALLNVVLIPVIHLGVSWFFTRLPLGWFPPGGFLYRCRRWEAGGRFYERVLGIRAWKDRLPDAGPWFGGHAKAGIARRDPDYLRHFRAETCRSEAAHYAQIPAICLVLAWTPWPVAALVIVAYAVLSNLPCILVQRYTRARLTRVLAVCAKT